MFEELTQAFKSLPFHAGDSCQVCSVPASTDEYRGCFVRADCIPFNKFSTALIFTSFILHLREDKRFSPSSSVPSCTGEVFGCFYAES